MGYLAILYGFRTWESLHAWFACSCLAGKMANGSKNSITGDFLSTVQKHNAQFLEHHAYS